jgi:hypothetical protein
MDLAISLITPELLRQRGAKAFDDGAPVDGHGMNPGAAAIVEWTRGYRLQQIAAMQRPLTVRKLGGGTPP